MKFFTALATTTVIGASLITATPARAAGCYTATAAKIIREVVRGGGSPQEAVSAAADDGVLNSKSCLVRTRGYMRGYQYGFSDVLKVMNW